MASVGPQCAWERGICLISWFGLRADAAFAVEQFAMSERQACRLVELDRSSYRYEPRADHNADLRTLGDC